MNIQDPRYLNHIFEGQTASAYFEDYRDSLSQALNSIDLTQLDRAFELILSCVQKNKKIFLAGNGGSSSISDHLTCDLSKGTLSPQLPPIKVLSLSSNGALLTAIANDYSYEKVFSTQLEILGEEGDLLITISASGNSPNIVKALSTAQSMKLNTIALTGFSGGQCKDLCDVSLHFAYKNYGIIEDCHQIVLQSLGQFLAKCRDEQIPGENNINDRKNAVRSV